MVADGNRQTLSIVEQRAMQGTLVVTMFSVSNDNRALDLLPTGAGIGSVELTAPVCAR